MCTIRANCSPKTCAEHSRKSTEKRHIRKLSWWCMFEWGIIGDRHQLENGKYHHEKDTGIVLTIMSLYLPGPVCNGWVCHKLTHTLAISAPPRPGFETEMLKGDFSLAPSYSSGRPTYPMISWVLSYNREYNIVCCHFMMNNFNQFCFRKRPVSCGQPIPKLSIWFIFSGFSWYQRLVLMTSPIDPAPLARLNWLGISE